VGPKAGGVTERIPRLLSSLIIFVIIKKFYISYFYYNFTTFSKIVLGMYYHFSCILK